MNLRRRTARKMAARNSEAMQHADLVKYARSIGVKASIRWRTDTILQKIEEL